MQCDVVASGSKGNAVVLNQSILIDCGVPLVKIMEYVPTLRLVLLTHIHKDHFLPSTIRGLAELRPTLRFGMGSHLLTEALACGIAKRNIDIMKPGKIYDYRSVRVSPINLYHDVENFGYRIYIGDERAIYATDTGTMDGIEAKNYDLYLIEANYKDLELRDRISEKQKNGMYAYEARVPYTHLSYEQANNFIVDNGGVNAQCIYLHRHGGEENDKQVGDHGSVDP